MQRLGSVGFQDALGKNLSRQQACPQGQLAHSKGTPDVAGSKGEVVAGLRHFRSAPENGHRRRARHVCDVPNPVMTQRSRGVRQGQPETETIGLSREQISVRLADNGRDPDKNSRVVENGNERGLEHHTRAIPSQPRCRARGRASS